MMNVAKYSPERTRSCASDMFYVCSHFAKCRECINFVLHTHTLSTDVKIDILYVRRSRVREREIIAVCTRTAHGVHYVESIIRSGALLCAGNSHNS